MFDRVEQPLFVFAHAFLIIDLNFASNFLVFLMIYLYRLQVDDMYQVSLILVNSVDPSAPASNK